MELHYTLLAVYSMHTKLLMKKLAGTGLTSGQPKILDFLKAHDGSMQNDIAAACFIEPASLTSALNGMEANGLVKRRRHNGNRRTYYVYLTPKGKEMCDVISNAFAEIRSEVFAAIPAEDAAAFMDTFAAIYDKLKGMMEAYNGSENA